MLLFKRKNLKRAKIKKRQEVSIILLRILENHIKVIFTNKANFVMGSCI